jgi:hypothetical protein
VQGPILRSRVRRTVLVYAAVIVLGMLPSLLDWSPRWRAFGLGLVLPGGGFLYTSDPLFVAVTLAVCGYAFLLLFLRAMHVFLPAAWLLAAVLAPLRVESGLWTWATWFVPALAVTCLVAVFVRKRVRFRKERRIGTRRNAVLADVPYAAPIPAAETPPLGPELSPDELARQRWALDLALQPVDEWTGFEFSDQWSMGAARYQCNWLQWSLALAQYCRAPAFQGYVAEAQRNLILKATDRRVWRYWQWENLLGNLDANPDPIRRDNIMYSGYIALMLETYASNTGDTRFDEPDSLPLRWSAQRTFNYDATRVADAVHRNLARTEWGMFPCEPGFVFPACNSIALAALFARDQRLGTDDAGALLPAFRRSLDEEFTSADGRIIAIMCSRYGFTNSVLTTIASDAGQAVFLHPLAPDVSARTWEIVRREHLEPDGRVRHSKSGRGRRFDAMDPGNRTKARTFFYATMAMIAREMGDDEVVSAVTEQAESGAPVTEERGARWFRDSSNFANGYWTFALFGRKQGFFDLVLSGYPESWRTGPVLAAAAYPDVLVARAVTDGQALDLVLRPGGAGGRERLRIERLVPGREYALTGAVEPTVTAGPDGAATVEVDLTDRLALRVAPA